MNKKGLIVSIILVVVVIAVILFVPAPETEAPLVEEAPEEGLSAEVVDLETTVVSENIVNYNDSGFSPSEITILQGDSVTFVNNSSRDMWVASDVHPTHQNYAGTSLQEHCGDEENEAFDACERFSPGEDWTFTFDQFGEWSYHNHSNASHTGVVIVE